MYTHRVQCLFDWASSLSKWVAGLKAVRVYEFCITLSRGGKSQVVEQHVADAHSTHEVLFRSRSRLVSLSCQELVPELNRNPSRTIC